VLLEAFCGPGIYSKSTGDLLTHAGTDAAVYTNFALANILHGFNKNKVAADVTGAQQ
jgi:hypothetical protein